MILQNNIDDNRKCWKSLNIGELTDSSHDWKDRQNWREGTPLTNNQCRQNHHHQQLYFLQQQLQCSHSTPPQYWMSQIHRIFVLFVTWHLPWQHSWRERTPGERERRRKRKCCSKRQSPEMIMIMMMMMISRLSENTIDWKYLFWKFLKKSPSYKQLGARSCWCLMWLLTWF